MTARRKVCPTFQLKGSHTLMPVSPIEERADESLSRSGETEKADEGEKEMEVGKDKKE